MTQPHVLACGRFGCLRDKHRGYREEISSSRRGLNEYPVRHDKADDAPRHTDAFHRLHRFWHAPIRCSWWRTRMAASRLRTAHAQISAAPAPASMNMTSPKTSAMKMISAKVIRENADCPGSYEHAEDLWVPIVSCRRAATPIGAGILDVVREPEHHRRQAFHRANHRLSFFAH